MTRKLYKTENEILDQVPVLDLYKANMDSFTHGR